LKDKHMRGAAGDVTEDVTQGVVAEGALGARRTGA